MEGEDEEGKREGRKREGMDEERGKGERGNGRDGTRHGMGIEKRKGGRKGREREERGYSPKLQFLAAGAATAW